MWSYKVANANLLCSDVNMEPIGSLIECRNAVLELKKSNPKIEFRYEEVVKTRPKGCNEEIYTNYVYWNTHPTGRRYKHQRPVCKLGKK